MTTQTLPTLLDKNEAAKAVRMHPLTLLRKAREGKIGSIRSGKRVFFTADHIHEYLANGETKAVVPKAKPARNPRYGK